MVYLIASWAIPILDNHATFRLRLPELLDISYWRTALFLYFGYLIIISVFFFIKTRVLPSGGGGKH